MGEYCKTKELYGLIGFPLGHSWSAIYFNEKFRSEGDANKEYRLFPLKNPDEFPDLLEKYPELKGLNVTIPYKEKIIPYLNKLDESARLVGAVNTIRIMRKFGITLTIGYNTDSKGFFQTLEDHELPGPALILGTGGAAKAVAQALREKNIPFSFVSRKHRGKGVITYNDISIDVITSHLLIINATPLGMYPDIDKYPPIPYHHLSGNHFLYDLIYNPEETEFIKLGKAMNTKTMNGKQMLINQAELSYRVFTLEFPFSSPDSD
jgi:shikimate dehydrogenase